MSPSARAIPDQPGAERGLRAGAWRRCDDVGQAAAEAAGFVGADAPEGSEGRAGVPLGHLVDPGGVAFVLILIAIALLAPHGTWLAGCILMATGGVLILVGHLAGAFGAFSEDFLYGLFYLLIPLYTAYYIVTRWDDMWVWFACSTVGAGLSMAGIELVRWAEAAV